MGVCEVPVDYQDYATEAEEWQDVIADNRLQEFAEPDRDLINEILTVTEDIEAELTGYNIDNLLEDVSEVEPPRDFQEYDENIEIEYTCPKCGYSWSGKANHGEE